MKKGIYEQGNYINEKNDKINTFYIYDFVPEETIKMHAMKSEHTIGSRTANYYFSYNANIPNQALVLAESLSEANKLIDDYSYGIKYAFIKNQAGEIMVPAGAVADDGMLAGMSFYVEGIDGEIPQ